MLSELYRAERSLDTFRVDVGELHPWVKPLGKAELLIASVDSSGLVKTIEHRPKEEAAKIFKIQQSNHANFPQVNWPAPVWNIDRVSSEFREWQQIAATDAPGRAAALGKAIATAAITKEQQTAIQRVGDFCGGLAARFSGAQEDEFAAFPELLRRLRAGWERNEVWLRALREAVLAAAAEGNAPLEMVETLLVGSAKGQKVPILFDLADCTSFPRRVASTSMGRYYSRVLNVTETASGETGVCGLSGVEGPLEKDKMPSPRLPVLGDAVLMSMNRDTPCQTRYGRIGMDIFPVAQITAKALNTALTYLTRPEREGKNWKAVPAGGKKKPNLLVVFLENAPELEAKIATAFTGGEESAALYEEVSKDVATALEAAADTDGSPLLHLFVLNKIDPGRVQVELSNSFTAAQVIEGAKAWREGARNRPLLALNTDGFVPSPVEMLRCFERQWELGAARSGEAPGAHLSDVYEVLIAGNEEAGTTAGRLLCLATRRTEELFRTVGHAAHRNRKEAWKGMAKDAAKQASIAASVMGILLEKAGHRKERYMEEAAYLIGRFLSLADTLHAQYCEEVRDGAMPPQLIGSALLPTAITDREKALARMLTRIRPYSAWAKTRGTALARWAWGEMGKIANQLQQHPIEAGRMSDREQAQLLLGYAARTEKAEGAQA